MNYKVCYVLDNVSIYIELFRNTLDGTNNVPIYIELIIQYSGWDQHNMN